MLALRAASVTAFCYNVLCEKYATRQVSLQSGLVCHCASVSRAPHPVACQVYRYCPSWALDWDYRKQNINKEILKHSSGTPSLSLVPMPVSRCQSPNASLPMPVSRCQSPGASLPLPFVSCSAGITAAFCSRHHLPARGSRTSLSQLLCPGDVACRLLGPLPVRWTLSCFVRGHCALSVVIVCCRGCLSLELGSWSSPLLLSYRAKSRARTMSEKDRETVDGCAIFFHK